MRRPTRRDWYDHQYTATYSKYPDSRISELFPRLGAAGGRRGSVVMNGPDIDRSTEVTRALSAAINAMRVAAQADNDNAKLLAIRNGAKEITALDDDTGAIDHLSDVALDMYDIEPNIIQNMLALGVNMGKAARTSARAQLPPEIEEAIKQAKPPPGSAKADGAGEKSPDDGIEGALPFETFNAHDWMGKERKPQEWAVRERIPVAETGIISGDGGTGKTLLGLQACIAFAAERPDWLNGVVERHGPALMFSAEEKLREMHRRVGRILDHFVLTFDDLGDRLHFICDPDEPVLATVDPRTGLATPTRALHRLERWQSSSRCLC
jgi:hypothetical protein